MATPSFPAIGEHSFDEFYYRNCCGRPYLRDDHWLAFFGHIAERIVAELQPKRVLDAGCAIGLLVETLRNGGVEAFGVDISSYAIEHVDPLVSKFCRCGSITDPLEERYDLIISIEVAEHMPMREAERAIENICAHTDRVLFSSSPLDYREPTHVNVHPTDYWAEQFARQGFHRDVDFDATFITPWAVLFRKSEEPLHRIIRRYERHFWELQCNASGARSYSIEIQDRLAHTESERDSLRARLDEAEAAIAARLADTAVVAAERDSLRTKLDEAEAAITAGLADAAAIATERDSLRTTLDEAKAAITAGLAVTAAVATERDSLRTTLEEAEAAITAGLAATAAVATERDSLRTRLDEAEAAITAGLAATAAVATERDSLRTTLEEAKAAITAGLAVTAAVATERDSLRTRLDEVEAAITARFAEVAAVAKQRDEMADRLSRSAQTIANMERSLFWRMRNACLRMRRLVTPNAT